MTFTVKFQNVYILHKVVRTYHLLAHIFIDTMKTKNLYSSYLGKAVIILLCSRAIELIFFCVY